MKIKETIIKILFFLFFAAMLINMAGEDIKIKHCSAIMTGTVVSVTSGTVKKNGTTYIHYNARVEPDEKGVFDYYALMSDNTLHKYAEGDKVNIYYDPKDTDTYYIQYAEPKKNIVAIVGIFSIIMIPTALSVYCKLKRSGLLDSRRK